VTVTESFGVQRWVLVNDEATELTTTSSSVSSQAGVVGRAVVVRRVAAVRGDPVIRCQVAVGLKLALAVPVEPIVLIAVAEDV
jgi:hypothetical protein